jgi:hypothetical protein
MEKDKNLLGGVMVIDYKHGAGGAIAKFLPQCPNGKASHVGSYNCEVCQCHLYRDKIKKQVYCAYDMKIQTRYVYNGVAYTKNALIGWTKKIEAKQELEQELEQGLEQAFILNANPQAAVYVTLKYLNAHKEEIKQYLDLI